MKDFDITIGNVTANTDMIEEDVIRSRLGLEPKKQEYQHQESQNEDYFECRNSYLDGTWCC